MLASLVGAFPPRTPTMACKYTDSHMRTHTGKHAHMQTHSANTYTPVVVMATAALWPSASVFPTALASSGMAGMKFSIFMRRPITPACGHRERHAGSQHFSQLVCVYVRTHVCVCVCVHVCVQAAPGEGRRKEEKYSAGNKEECGPTTDRLSALSHRASRRCPLARFAWSACQLAALVLMDHHGMGISQAPPQDSGAAITLHCGAATLHCGAATLHCGAATSHCGAPQMAT